jgi:hypothetical protein
MIKRFLLGVAVGGAAVWLLDPRAGAARRRQAREAVALAAPVVRRAGGAALAVSRRATGAISATRTTTISPRRTG